MYKKKIQELQETQNKILNNIKTKTNIVNYYKSLLAENDQSWQNIKSGAINKMNFLKRKLLIGKIFTAGMLLNPILAFTSLFPSAIIVAEIVFLAGTVLLNYNAKQDKINIEKIKNILNACNECEEQLQETIHASQENIDKMQKMLDEITNKLKELQNAQEVYERISTKYSFKINFGEINKSKETERQY